MARTCNIDTSGRLIRAVIAGGTLLGAVLLAIFWAAPAGSALAWVLVALAGVAGLFGLYEAQQGWCAARALGIKTPF